MGNLDKFIDDRTNLKMFESYYSCFDIITVLKNKWKTKDLKVIYSQSFCTKYTQIKIFELGDIQMSDHSMGKNIK